LKSKTNKLVISDRRDKIWKDRCYHEINWKTGKECNRPLDEDTGECPKGHGRSLHGCATSCCGIFVAGNHKFCRYHRKKKVKTICKIQKKIMAKYRSIIWGKNANPTGLDFPEDRKKFEEWKQIQLQKSYDKDVLKAEVLLREKILLEEKENQDVK